jgi:hypothetical protein
MPVSWLPITGTPRVAVGAPFNRLILPGGVVTTAVETDTNHRDSAHHAVRRRLTGKDTAGASRSSPRAVRC